MSPDDYLRQRLEHHLPDEQGKEELIALLLPLLSMGARQSASTWQGLREEVAQAVVLALKDDVDRYVRISWEGALSRATQIIQVGEARTDLAIQALGAMAKGDALKLVTGRLEEAWTTFDYAGELFMMSHLPMNEREIGWARTRIGRLYICVEVGKIEEGFKDAERACMILEREHIWGRLLSLYLAWGSAYIALHDYEPAVTPFQRALAIADTYPQIGESQLAPIYNNLAMAEQGCGHPQKALELLREAEKLCLNRGESSGVAIARLNIGALFLEAGNYREALRSFNDAEPICRLHFPKSWVALMVDLMECNFMLNRITECKSLGEQVLSNGDTELTLYERGLILRWLAKAEATHRGYGEAETQLMAARQAFVQSGAKTLAIQCQLDQALLACQRGELAAASQLLRDILGAENVETGIFYRMFTAFVAGEVTFQNGDSQAARQYFANCLNHARQDQFIAQQYQAHLRLGQLAEAATEIHKARRHYQAALAVLVRMQQGLTLTLGPDFLTTRQAAFHGLMNLELKNGNITGALDLLETSKSYLFIDYLQRTRGIQWNETADKHPLSEQVTRYRAELSRLNRITVAERDDLVSQRIVWLNRQVRTLTEQLYLQQGQNNDRPMQLPAMTEIQVALPNQTGMVLFYDDGTHLSAFVITRARIYFIPLELGSDRLVALVNELHEHHTLTLNQFLPDDVRARVQARKGKRLYAELGRELIQPITTIAPDMTRWTIVPFGALHHVPFHLLRIQERYWIEDTEIVILPTAGLALQKAPVPSSEIFWMGYSEDGLLPEAVNEVKTLFQRWGGNLYVEDSAVFQQLFQSSALILHLSTHAVHDTDRYFDQSYIRMADRDVYSDDLLKVPLQHGLITLSACETGVSKIAPGDELIGLGRALLYAGAGAVLLSMWRVREELTARWMAHFYERLLQGDDKAAAHRYAMVTMLAAAPDAHPVHWGGFQLIGNPCALIHETRKEMGYEFASS